VLVDRISQPVVRLGSGRSKTRIRADFEAFVGQLGNNIGG